MRMWTYFVGKEERSCSEQELFQKKAIGEISDNTFIRTDRLEVGIPFSKIQLPYAKPLEFWKFIVSFFGAVLAYIVLHIVALTYIKHDTMLGMLFALIIFVPFFVWHYILVCKLIYRSWMLLRAIPCEFNREDSPSKAVLWNVIPGINLVGNIFYLPRIAANWESFRSLRSIQGMPVFNEHYVWIYAITLVSSIFLGLKGMYGFAIILGIVAIVMYLLVFNCMCKIINFAAKHFERKIA